MPLAGHTKKMKEEYLHDFINFRYNFIEDLPRQKLMPDVENYNLYKCRGNFFIGIFGRIDRLIRKGVINDPEAITKGNEFMQYVTQRDFSKFSTKEDIDKANEILDYMIKHLT